jgi:molybdopterin synthase sulfur carrier subunit
MSIKVLLFGAIKDTIGSSELELSDMHSTDRVKEHLEAEFPFIRSTRYILALNQQRVESDRPVQDGDEIALMPPFAGG